MADEPRMRLSERRVERPPDWITSVNEPLKSEDLDVLRVSVDRGRPFGEADWIAKTAKRLGLGNTLRGLCRPRKLPDQLPRKQLRANDTPTRPRRRRPRT